MTLWDWWNSLLLQSSPSAPSARRLDGRSRALLAASIKTLPCETPGWITNKEAKQLFSSVDDQYAVGEMDEVGKGNIADFAAHLTPRCSFEFMPVEGRVYFTRKRMPARDRGWSTSWELRMVKSRAEMMERWRVFLPRRASPAGTRKEPLLSLAASEAADDAHDRV